MEELKAKLRLRMSDLRRLAAEEPSSAFRYPPPFLIKGRNSPVNASRPGEEEEGTEGEAFNQTYNVEDDDEMEAEAVKEEARQEEIIKKFLERKEQDSGSKVPPLFLKDYKVKNALQTKLRDDSRQLLLQRRNDELFDQDELINLWKKLEERSSTVDPMSGEKLMFYTEFKQFVDELEDNKNLRSLRKFLTPRLFLKLYTDDAAGRISANSVFNYIMKRTWYQQTRIGLSIYDDSGRGLITDKNLECYVHELIPTLPRLNGMDPSFLPFYTGTAVRKFFFFLDPHRTGRIRIMDILSSGFIDDFLDLREDATPQDSNWFSYESSMRVYGTYLNLDRDHNGMLNKEEFMAYNERGTSLTETFVTRLFQEALTFDGEMDYRTYLDFVLAAENRREVASITYFFGILDAEHKGFLNGFDLHYFYKDIEQYMKKHAPESVKFHDLKDEIFDMVRPKDPMKITLADLIKCGNGHTVMHILTDYSGFWMYENRESSSSDSPKNSAQVSEV